MFWPPTVWPVPPVNGWNITVDKRLGHTRVTVDMPLWKGEKGRRFRCYSSAIEGRPLVADEWTDGVADTIEQRMKQNHGGEKGRVIYIGRDEPGRERAPLAVAAWHLPPAGPLELLEMDIAVAVRGARPKWVHPLGFTLMHALRTTAAHQAIKRADDRLAWITNDAAVARRAFEDWGFNGLRPAKFPQHNHAKFYLRRIEK